MAKPKSRPQLSLQSAHLYDDGAGIPQDHWSRAFFEHVRGLFHDEEFAPMYRERGRNPISPSFLACISLLQYMFRASDRVAVENTIMRRDWRIALGITPDYAGFDASVLCNFRKRLREHQQERLIFDGVVQLVQELGLIKTHRHARVDATELLADVAILSRAEALMEAIRIVVSDAHKRLPELREQVAFLSLFERYGEEVWLGRTSGGDQKLADLARDAQALLALCGSHRPRGYEVLEQMLQENFILDADGNPDPLPPDQRPPDHIVTPHEPDAQVGKKGSKLWTGDKVHIVETVQPGEQSFLVDMLVTPPRTSDDTFLPVLALRTVTRTPLVDLLIADGGYASATNSHLTDLMGLDLLSRPGCSNSKMKIPIEDFVIDFDRHVAICPQGHYNASWREAGRTYQIRFPKLACDSCPRRSECTRDARGRRIAPSIHYPELQRERERFQQPESVELYKQRAGVEATFSKLVHQCGFRRSRYRGAANRTLHALLAGAALNVLRLLHCCVTKEQRVPNAAAALSCLTGCLYGGHTRPQGAF